MKIIHVIPSLAVGGAEMCLTKLVTAERPNAPEAIVVSLLQHTNSHFERALQDAKIRHEVIGIRRALDLPRAITFLARLIRTEKPDCLQGWLYYGDLIATLGLLLSGRRANTRLYWGIRCSDLDVARYGRQLKITMSACKNLSRVPNAIIANSFAGRDVHAKLGYQRDKLAVVHNGIDVNLFTPMTVEDPAFARDLNLSRERPLVGIVGRVDPQKDYATFLCVVERLPEVNFMAAGKDTTSLPPRDNLKSIGICEDMPRLLGALDLLICTSAFGEGFPNVVAEAMACGTPVVTTDVGDAADIVGDTGRVCAVGDVSGLSDSIAALLCEADNERHQRRAMARARIVSNYSLDRMIKAFDQLHLHDITHDAPTSSQRAV